MIHVNDNCFILQGKSISYILSVDENNFLYHLYFGKKMSSDKVYQLHRNLSRGRTAQDRDFSVPPVNDVGWLPKNSQGASLDELPQEYPSFGHIDLRTPAFQIESESGDSITDLRYESHQIVDGKPELEGLPSVYDNDNTAKTLIVKMVDELQGVLVDLSYTVFNDSDAICRDARITNIGDQNLTLHSALSANVDFIGSNYDAVYLAGGWGRECEVKRTPIGQGKLELSNARGGSGHQINPFVVLCDQNTTETNGAAYGFSLVYSGNHSTVIEVDQYNVSRVQMGINPSTFRWELNPSESFQTPECVLVYSNSGFGKLSRTYHDLYRKKLIRGTWKDKDRPVLINNWEATYFDFNEEKVIDIATRAKEAGIELFVLDDGWFGNRNTDHCSLGDWEVNTEKIPSGIKGLAEKVNNIGLEFGLWFEPEMISPDSDLYRKHPDWAIQVPGREPSITRHQYVLNLTKPEVQEFIIESVSSILDEANISYVKWDMNRHITDMPSADFAHKYMLSLYHILETIVTRFPNVLFESCSGGGGRFDPGLLHYMPQVWTSDNSDAAERLFIQYGTSMCYPLSTMGSHVSAVPNHQTGRVTPLKSRGDVALSGTFGYELDIRKLTDEEFEEVKKQVIESKSLRTLIRTGDFYRLISPFSNNECAWQVVSKNAEEVFVLHARILSVPNPNLTVLKLQGLDESAQYENIITGDIYGGDELMYYGIPLNIIPEDFSTQTIRLKKVN